MRTPYKRRAIPRLPDVILCVAALAASPLPAAAQANLLTDIGPYTAVGINNAHHVGLEQGIYANGTVTPFPAGFTGAAINASDEVAGELVDAQAVGTSAFYVNGTVTDIGPFLPFPDETVAVTHAVGLSNSGLIVGNGNLNNPDSTAYGYLYDSTHVTVINSFPGVIAAQFQSSALGVNDSGQVTGEALKTDDVINGVVTDAYIYDSATSAMTDLGPGAGHAINANGHVTGSNAVGHAFLYSNGKLTDLGSAGVGMAINASDRIVGLGGTDGSGFFYNGVMIDLSSLIDPGDPLKPFLKFQGAVGISDDRMIVFNAMDTRTQINHAYLLQAPSLDVAPGPLVFASQPIGTISQAQTLTFTNAGTASLALGAITISGDFAQTNTCGTTLAAQDSCTATVEYQPTAGGSRIGSLTIVSARVSIVVPLSGSTPITVSLTPSARTTTAGTPVTLTWSATQGASCTATSDSTTADGWSGSLPASGNRPVTETSAGDYTYEITCTAGSQSVTAQTQVVVNWPPVSVTLAASPTTLMAGQAATLTWTSKNATSCMASGGGVNDNWPGSRATNGTATVTEAFVPASQVTLTFTLTCTSSVSNLSSEATAKIAEVPPPKSGGGGALDIRTLIALLGILAVRWAVVGRPAPRLERVDFMRRQGDGRSDP
ncbi:MAG TPA: choice-of-anchor D domain-containing protein [Steroidobacteraceae bacterium]|nr:choice-of-anchor D domain-containing protein [Steroidobacteraceae bacterium]